MSTAPSHLYCPPQIRVCRSPSSRHCSGFSNPLIKTGEGFSALKIKSNHITSIVPPVVPSSRAPL